jgi:general secretion pathway protein K
MIWTRKRPVVSNAPEDARQRGLALLIVLWIIVSAALVVSAFNAAVRSGVSFVGSEVQLTRTEALLDAGVEIAAARLMDEEEARRWQPDATRHDVAFAGVELAITIEDANGLVDLNKADKELLMGLLRQFAGSELKAGQLRDHILRARGKPSTPRRTSKETMESRPFVEPERNPAATASNEIPAFIDVGQLRGLEGMTVELYRAIAPLVTVYSEDGRINPLAAPEEVLGSVPGLSRRDIEMLRAAPRAPKKEQAEEQEAMLGEIARRAGAYLTDKPGPAFIVAVEVLSPGAKKGARAVYVIATGLDESAPYRLIAKRPIGPEQMSGS